MPPCTWVVRLAQRSAAGAARRGGDGGGVGELVAAGGRGPGRVPHRGGGHLGGHAHVGAVVLHAPGTWRWAGRTGCAPWSRRRPSRCTRGPGRRPRPTRITRSRSTSVRAAPGSTVAGAPSSVTRAERRVGSRLLGTSTVTPSPTSTTATSSPTATSSTWASPPPSTAPALPEAVPSGDRDVAAEGDRAEGGAVGHAGEPAGLRGVVAGRGERGAGDRRRHERARAPPLDRAPRPRRRAPRCRSPEPPCSSGRWRPCQPSPVSAFQNGGQLLGRAPRAGPGPRRGRPAWPGSRRRCRPGPGGHR